VPLTHRQGPRPEQGFGATSHLRGGPPRIYEMSSEGGPDRQKEAGGGQFPAGGEVRGSVCGR
jgi:hypothetical protein